MPKRTAPQTRTAICCLRASAILGTLRARLMVAKERMPSVNVSRLVTLQYFDWLELTNGSNDLCLEAELVLETAGEVGETALAIVTSVGHLADVVEHVSAGEEQDKDQADSGPQVAVLDDGKDVGRSDGKECDDTDDGSCNGDNLDIIDRTLDRWMRGVGKVTAQPRVDRLSLVGTDAIGMLVVEGRINI